MKRGVIAQSFFLFLMIAFLIAFIPLLSGLVSAFQPSFQSDAGVNFVATMIPFAFAIVGIGFGLAAFWAGLKGG
jgi:hypothetical protein